jgi:hypothetical protein
MTVSNTSRRAGPFYGNGVTKQFPFTFKVFSADDLEITYTDADGNEAVVTSNFTVTLNANQDTSPGGTITYPVVGAAMVNPESLVAIGDLDYEQGTDLTNVGRFLPQAVEDALDRLAILSQQLFERLQRTLKFPVSDGEPDQDALPSAAQRALKLLGFDETGAPRAVAGVDGVTSDEVVVIATEGQTVFNISPLVNLPGTEMLQVEADGIGLTVGEDYTETSASIVTLDVGVPEGTVMKFKGTGTPISMGVFGSSVKYTPTGADPRVDSIQTVLRKVVKRPQDNGDVLGDATAAVQNAINALEASGAELLELDIGDLALRIDGTLTNTQPIKIIGQGVRDLDNARPTTMPTRGSWLIHNNAVGPLWQVNQHTSKNCGMEGVGIFQTGHPEPGPGWTPAVRDWVIRAENTQGTLRLDRVHFHNVYQGVLVDDAARPRFDHITGQFFYRGVKFDRIYDEGSCDHLRGWTYWSEHSDVLGWMQANSRLVTLGRVDGLHFGGRLFGFAVADVLYLGAGAVAGGARVITVEDIYADFCKRALSVDNGVSHVTVGSLFHLGQAWPAAPVAALAGSCGIEVISGSNSEILVGNYTGSLCEGSSVKVGGTNNQVWIGNPIFEQFDKAASGVGPITAAATNLVFLGNAPQVLNYAGASVPLITGGAAGIVKVPAMQQFIGGSALNKVIMAAAATGQLAVVTAEGDADAGLALVAQAAGIVNLGSAANKLSFYAGTAAAKGSVTGSRANPEQALASLITYLATRGLLTDGTTV